MDDKIKINYIGDSVPITSNDTNTINLLNQLYTVFNYCKTGRDSSFLNNIEFSENEICIIQLGIVDCSPRALSRRELLFIKKIPILRFIIRKVVSKFRLKIINFRPLKVYVDLKEFTDNIENFLIKSNSKIILVGIGPITKSVNTNLYLHRKQINTYNDKLQYLSNKHNCIYVDLCKVFSQNPKESNFIDGLHFSQNGHREVFNILKNIICRINSEL
jgi:lysophospholipase L1-like esterase